MFETIGSTFFDALRQAAERHLERDHPCIEALDAAARSTDPATTAAAQEALAALDPAIMNALMAEAHKLLRENPGRILDSWNPPGIRQ
ncbi:MAG: hypothetical protein QM636_09735 [Rhizobium sp.]